jgi:hypothetical protein
MHPATRAAFFDELQKIAQTSPAFEAAIQRGAGQMTPEAYAVGHADWARQQAVKKQMAPAVARHRAMQGRVAKKAVKPGLLKRVLRLAA